MMLRCEEQEKEILAANYAPRGGIEVCSKEEMMYEEGRGYLLRDLPRGRWGGEEKEISATNPSREMMMMEYEGDGVEKRYLLKDLPER